MEMHFIIDTVYPLNETVEIKKNYPPNSSLIEQLLIKSSAQLVNHN